MNAKVDPSKQAPRVELPAELRGISKVYPADRAAPVEEKTKRPADQTWANRRVSLDIRRGEILCLAGENGAGKTTLMKILYGLTPPTEGEIFVRGKPVRVSSPLDANRLGIGMVHQHFMLFPELTVAQNVVMGIEPVKWGIFYDMAKANERVAEVITKHHFSVKADTPVQELTVGQMQQVEILKVLYRDVDIVILDEPTAMLTDQEIVSLFRTLKALAAAGKSLILSTHKLSEITEISDRVAIMRKGELVAVHDTKDIDEFEISRLMIGKGVDLQVNRKRFTQAEKLPVISFEDVTVARHGQKRPVLDRISFTAHAGEILGFAGVGGNGLGTLEAVLGGFLPITQGRILHRKRDISSLKTKALRREGLAYVPASRLSVGSAGGASVTENMIVNRRGEFSRRFFLDRRAITRFTGDLVERYGIAGGPGKMVRSLSGGNIQKLILAREIDQFRDYIVFSEPTWGLDVSAGRYVYEQIGILREKGAAILILSSNLDEILANADRIFVFYRGTVAAEIANPAAENAAEDRETTARIKEEIGAHMMGLKHQDKRETRHGR
ncbi:heme ABC transporter ATP-binding protein [Spirochaetia bacterium]|nr:heme ABC transporter ATP-binding protein [Spirochaetia bacterium]